MAEDRFFDHPRSTFTTSQGPVELPVLYRDASALLAYFRVSHRRAADVLAATPFAPVRFVTGFAMAGIAFFDYRDCTAGPYRECALVVAAAPRSWKAPILPVVDLLRGTAHRAIAYHVLDLPVTTPLADAAGRELWGLPKFVTPIDVDLGPEAVACAVHAPEGGSPILTLAGRLGGGLSVPAAGLLIDSVVGGEPLRTVVDVRGRMHTGLGGGIEVRVGTGARMAPHLAALGLDGAHPMIVQACDRAQFVLHAGTALAALRAAA